MIINLTQHNASLEQVRAGVIEPESKELVKEFLTFDSLPNQEEILKRVSKLATIAEMHGAHAAMIGGAPFLMSALERELKNRRITPVYAFSKRVVTERTTDGKTEKISVFRHLGFVEV